MGEMNGGWVVSIAQCIDKEGIASKKGKLVQTSLGS